MSATPEGKVSCHSRVSRDFVEKLGTPELSVGGGKCLRLEKGSLKIKNTTTNNNKKFVPNREEVN